MISTTSIRKICPVHGSGSQTKGRIWSVQPRASQNAESPRQVADSLTKANRTSGSALSDTARSMATATLGRLVIDSLKEDDNSAGTSAKQDKLLKINLDLWLWQANQLRRSKKSENVAKAIEIYEYCIKRDSSDGRSYACLARIKEWQGDIKNARGLLEEGVTATKGECVKVWQAWAMLEYRQGNTTRARTLFDAATFAKKSYAAAWHAWAQLEESAGNLEKALELLKRGLRNVPNSMFILRSLGAIQSKLGDYEAARETFRYGLNLKPNSPALWLSWGKLETSRGNYDDAYRILSNGIRKCPQNPNLRVAMASCEKARGRDPVSYLHAALQLEPKHSPTWVSLAVEEAKAASELQRRGLIEESEEKKEKVRQCYMEATKLDPKNIPAWQSYGFFEAKNGDHEKARHIFTKGLRNCSRGSADLRNKASSIFHTWAVMEDKSGRVHLAHELLKASLRANVRHRYSWTYWIKICERDDRLEQASLIRNNQEKFYDIRSPGSTEIATLHSGLLRPSIPIRESINQFLNKRLDGKVGRSSNIWGHGYDQSIDDIVYHSIGRWILAGQKLDKKIDRYTDDQLKDYFKVI